MNGAVFIGQLQIFTWQMVGLPVTKHPSNTGCLGFHIYIYAHTYVEFILKKTPFHSFVLCLWMSRRIFQSKTKGSFGSQIDTHKTSDPWVLSSTYICRWISWISVVPWILWVTELLVYALSIQFGRGVKWGSDAPGLWRIACYLPLFLAVRIALITMPGKAFRCDKQWHFERLKQMSLVQLKWKWPCTTIKWGIPTRFVKMIFLGFKMFIFRDVVGCNAPKKMDIYSFKNHGRSLGSDLMGPPRQDPAREWASMQEPLEEEDDEEEAASGYTFSPFFSFFSHRKTDGWLTSKYTQMVPKGKPSTQTSHFWGSVAVSWLGGLAGRLKNERGNCVGP